VVVFLGVYLMALTDTEVRKSKPRSKPYRLTDAGGLHLFVTPRGGKLLRWKFRFRGKERLMAFGAYPEITLAMATEKHAEQRRLLKTGVSPMAARKAQKISEHGPERTRSRRWQRAGSNIGAKGRIHAMSAMSSGGSRRIFYRRLVTAPSQRSKRPSWLRWFKQWS
jgi:Arm DNA-binding domain